MNDSGALAPDFAHPPVVEVLLAVYFEPLRLLRTAQFGLLWQNFRSRFPRIEEHLSLPPIPGRLGLEGVPQIGVRLEMLDVPPAPRLWFLNEAGTEVVQIQQDRFIHNWRRLQDADQYPHYDGIRSTFEQELSEFASFVEEQEL